MSRPGRLAARLVFARSKIRDLAATRLIEVNQALSRAEVELASRQTRFFEDSRRRLRDAPNARSLWLVEMTGDAQRGWTAACEERLSVLREQHHERRRALATASNQLRAAERVRDRLRSEHLRSEARREQFALDDRSATERATKRRGRE